MKKKNRCSDEGYAMKSEEMTREELLRENERLKERLAEAEEILEAIREGRVDALVGYEPEGERIYTLKTADYGYRVLVEAISEGAAILSPDGSVYYCNRRFEDMLKAPLEKITGSPLIDHVAPDDCTVFYGLLRQQKEGRITKGEVRLIAGDGALLPVFFSLSPLEVGEFQGICLIATDLSEQKMTERELRGKNRELQDFASIASHDLREPLRKIQSFGDALKRKHGASLGKEGQDYLERMQSAAQRMDTLLQGLLAYSRVTSKAQPFAPVDLSQVIDEVIDDMEVRILETGGAIRKESLPIIDADSSQIRQLFQNIISNALKFCEGRHPEINIRAEALDGRLYRIMVEDNGIGFDEKHLDRIFAPFQRLHGRTEFEGTGMGLAICKKIVERHGGSITARSTPGKGSTFIITLPASRPVE